MLSPRGVPALKRGTQAASVNTRGPVLVRRPQESRALQALSQGALQASLGPRTFDTLLMRIDEAPQVPRLL